MWRRQKGGLTLDCVSSLVRPKVPFVLCLKFEVRRGLSGNRVRSLAQTDGLKRRNQRIAEFVINKRNKIEVSQHQIRKERNGSSHVGKAGPVARKQQ